MSTITVQAPLKVAVPRGAVLAADLALRLLRGIEKARGAISARREQSQRQGEASALRQTAMRFTRHDPRFTSDLMAAADRHERSQ